jgi:hypothetical protein
MVDMREKVKEDRGLIKKIELAIPGFRGYRKREDLRIADRLLREELVNRLSLAVRSAGGVREAVTKRKPLDLLEDAGRLVSRMNAIVERVRHAEQGYTGISPDYRILESELNKMYEWDLGLLDDVQYLIDLTDRLSRAARDMPESEMGEQLTAALDTLTDFEQLFDQRREAFVGLTVKE